MRAATLGIALAVTCVATYALAVELEPPLAKVHRIFIDQLGGGPTSDQMRDMLITALQNSGLFVITENPERADASLKGSSDDKIFVEEHRTADSVGVHGNAGSGSASGGGALGTSSSSHASVGIGVSENESSTIQDRKHESGASVRLVNAEGDVIWSTTQESNGGKFRSAMADVADKIARKLTDDTKKARGALTQ